MTGHKSSHANPLCIPAHFPSQKVAVKRRVQVDQAAMRGKKSPGVQLCRGSGRGSSTLLRGDPLLGHLIHSAGMVILRLSRVVL
jgi:hypothetical protein